MNNRRRPDQPELFAEVVESLHQRDEPFVNPDGAWRTRRVRPGGRGWRVLRDRGRHTIWTRRKPVVCSTVRLKRRWLP
jgi:hypothetical protein